MDKENSRYAKKEIAESLNEFFPSIFTIFIAEKSGLQNWLTVDKLRKITIHANLSNEG